jgi:tetratricopeptide (TPR) repeat protein
MLRLQFAVFLSLILLNFSFCYAAELEPVASARVHMKAANFPAAIAILTSALKKQMPRAQRIRVLETRRKCFYNTGDHARNLADLNEIIRLDPEHGPYVYLLRANAETALKKHFDAAKDLTTVIDMHPKTKTIHLTPDELYYRRGFCYIELKEYKKAIADFDTLLKLDETQEEAYKLRAECYANLGQNQRALDDFAKAIKHDPESSGSSYYARALVLEKMGKKKEAESDRRRAFELGYVPKRSRQSQGIPGNTDTEDLVNLR